MEELLKKLMNARLKKQLLKMGLTRARLTNPRLRQEYRAWRQAKAMSGDPAHSALAQQISAAMDLPPVRSRRREKGSVWAVAMTRNNADIIVPVVEHLFRQGVEGVVIADNRSTDETPALLSRLAEQHPIYLTSDREEGYYQASKMTLLSDWARRAGADWIVPFDADEFWFAPEATLADYLRNRGVDVVAAAIHNLFPVPGVAFGQGPWRLETTPHRLQKVAFRAHRYASLDYGNHRVSRPGSSSAGLRVVHVPWRSYEQFRQKGLEGSEALSQAGLAPARGYQWHTVGSLGEESAREVWARILAGDAVDGICWSPGGPVRLVNPLTWGVWDPDGVLGVV